jgi:hypothetical protein
MERLGSIPNWFYDFIVFVTPTAILIVGLSLGMHETLPNDWFNNLDLSAAQFVGLALGLLLLSYEYGRAAEMWSELFVLRPLLFLQRRLHITSRSVPPPDANLLGLPIKLEPEAARNRWTFYYYAYRVEPDIAQDLIKRYAWEKLARSSSFSYSLLFISSAIYGTAAAIAQDVRLTNGDFGFGSVFFTLIAAALCVASALEYRRRGFWNMDLLTKIAPVLAAIDIDADQQDGE